MAFNLLQIVKLISKSGSIAGTVGSLIKQFNTLKNADAGSKEFQQALDIQSKLNEKIEGQLSLLQEAVFKLQKSIKVLIYIVIFSLLISVAAIVLALLS